MPSKQKNNNLFNSISRSHLYWGRKPTSGLSRALEGLRPGDIFLDPFCGGGSAIITALGQGARVIASDLNPMAVFLSEVLIQPISVFALKEAFESIRNEAADNIIERYTMHCPSCRKEIVFGHLKWNSQNGEEIPEAVKVNCKYCGLKDLRLLSKNEINRQSQLSAIQPKLWFPKDPIRSHRKTKVQLFYELFTGRNLTSLSEIWHAIDKISSVRCKEIMQYVFTAMLYSCSSMQMFSKKDPSSSRGWTAPRFYLPSIRQEKNVWKAFENRFKTVLKAKEKINPICKFVRISDSMEKFEDSDDNVFIYEAGFSEFSFPKNLDVNHVFLDPPYNDDIDYMGFSEFWTCWLGMDSDIESGWHPGTIPIEENAERLLGLLQRIRGNTTSSCSVTLAYGSKKLKAWELMEETISKAGYGISEKIPILWDNSKKRGKNSSANLYLLLRRTSKKTDMNDYRDNERDLNELRFFGRIISFLYPDILNPEGIKEKLVNLAKPHLKKLVREINEDEELIRTACNPKAFNRLAFVFIKLILLKDGFRIVSADTSRFHDSGLSGYDAIESLPMPQGLAKGSDFVAENDKGNRILFCFYDESKVDAQKYVAKRVFDNDKDKFRTICYLITSTHDQIMQCRKYEQADNWPRGFFIEFDELLKKAREIDKPRFDHLSPWSDFDFGSRGKIEHFKARVISNTSVGGNGDPKHLIIRFKAPELKYAVPGQFVMIDTLSHDHRKRIDKRQLIHSSATSRNRLSKGDTIDLTPKSFLKRPFSIHRAFHKNFEWNCLKNMSLPLTLASITHTVFPHEFEIFCKIIENGKGTNELKEIKTGNTLQGLGPLGKITTVSDWRSEGIEEVHLVGGGVGMAPLIFFGQALKYYSFKIKAFIGIDRLDTLLSKGPLESGFAEDDPNKSYVYVGNLRRIGLNDNDIYVSFEQKDKTDNIDPRLGKINYYQGLVSQQYASYLDKIDETDNILVITCGPKPMLKALEKITSKLNVKMKVLLEKRMGCGIGVCMSCVCPTIKNNVEQYSRVCTEGPLFDSEDIDWQKL